jgi:hypothetical protein
MSRSCPTLAYPSLSNRMCSCPYINVCSTAAPVFLLPHIRPIVNCSLTPVPTSFTLIRNAFTCLLQLAA